MRIGAGPNVTTPNTWSQDSDVRIMVGLLVFIVIFSNFHVSCITAKLIDKGGGGISGRYNELTDETPALVR